MRWSAMVLAATLTLGCSAAHKHADKEDEGDEVKMALADVPPAVRDTLKREAGDAKIETVDKEQNDGQTVYETDVTIGGKNWEIKVDPNGKLISKKEDEEGEGKEEKEHDKK